MRDSSMKRNRYGRLHFHGLVAQHRDGGRFVNDSLWGSSVSLDCRPGILKLDVAEPQRPAPISILLSSFHATKIQ
jgi:hypothetical protein